jgi:hypothetical protein
LLFALVVALSWSIKPLDAAIPQALAKLIYPIDKSDLDPLRLLHFLASAILVANFVPREGPDDADPARGDSLWPSRATMEATRR